MQLVALEMNDPVYGESANQKTNFRRPEKSAVAQVATSKHSSDTSGEVSSVQCVLYGEGTHPLYLCDSFKKMPPRARFEFVCQKHLCFVCFSPRHKAQMCTRTPTCHIDGCNRKHTKLIHFDNSSACVSQSHSSHTTDSVVRTVCNTTCKVYVPMVPVTVNGVLPTWALLDSGSTNTSVSAKLAHELQLHGKNVKYQMSTVGSTTSVKSSLVSVNITSSHGKSVTLNNVMVVPSIPARHPKCPINITCYPHLQGIPLTCPTSMAQAEVLIWYGQCSLTHAVRCQVWQKP